MKMAAKNSMEYGDKIEANLHFAAYDGPIHLKGKIVRSEPGKDYYLILKKA